MKNTCSIKFLKQAFIGESIRMSSDKKTVPFDNKPMTNMEIIDYNQLGFKINHPSLPKPIWVKFDQLPLTRLTIKNGVISDEITFVENIVNHQMQLIRTLDTEYIDLIYSTKELEKIEDSIIPISQAIPGHIYKGAQCTEGTEMIFLGTAYVKRYKPNFNYYYKDKSKNKITTDGNVLRAYFAAPYNELSYLESIHYRDMYISPYSSKLSETQKKLEYDNYSEACENRRKSSNERYKILEFSITSKKIKNLIQTNKTNTSFIDKSFNINIINTEYLKNILYHIKCYFSNETIINTELSKLILSNYNGIHIGSIPEENQFTCNISKAENQDSINSFIHSYPFTKHYFNTI